MSDVEEGELPPQIKRQRILGDEGKIEEKPKFPETNKIVFLTKQQREALKKQKSIEAENRTKRLISAASHKKREIIQPKKRKEITQPVQQQSTNTSYRDSISVTVAPEAVAVVAPLDTATKSSLRDLGLLKFDDGKLKELANVEEFRQVKAQYLGLSCRERKPAQKPSEKFRTIFNFEWPATEDTTGDDANVLYRQRQAPQLLFGRGFRAGEDVRAQRKKNNFYDMLISKRTGVVAEKEDDDEDAEGTHWSRKPLNQMTTRDWRIMREDFQIFAQGRAPPPLRRWGESGLPRELLQAIEACGYTQPTPIQMQAIPIALEMRDLIGIAETGSGKTAAFVLPMLAYVLSLPRLNDETCADGPYGLVLAPSRELALQIDAETSKFAKFCHGIRAMAIVGGHSAETQAFLLRQGCEIVVGTPGRIRDCLERQFTVLSQCCYVILDEADRMIDMNFEEILNWILDQIPTSNLKSGIENEAVEQELAAKAGYRRFRVTQMFSATLQKSVERMAHKYLRSPAMVTIGEPGAGKREIDQIVEFVPEARKRQRLESLLMNETPPVIVFVNLRKVVDLVVKWLHQAGIMAVGLHGGKTQDAREENLASFKSGDVDVLVATDVAGRGLDVEGVQLVVNFDMPKDIVAYTHRVGRTGRAGKKGKAISFLTEADSAVFPSLKQFLQSAGQPVPQELANHPTVKPK